MYTCAYSYSSTESAYQCTLRDCVTANLKK